MASNSAAAGRSRCVNCDFEAPGGDDAWLRIEVPGLGRMTQCPNCKSTNVIAAR